MADTDGGVSVAPGSDAPSPETLRLLNLLKGRIEALPEEGLRQWNRLLPGLPQMFEAVGADLEWIEKPAEEDREGLPHGWRLKVESTASESRVQGILKELLGEVEKIKDSLPHAEITVEPGSVKLQTFKPDTMKLMTEIKDRLLFLSPPVTAALNARWAKRQYGVQVRIQHRTGQAELVTPLTVEEEDLLVEELVRMMGEVEEELTKIQYQRSSAHVVALEQQLLAYRVNSVAMKLEGQFGSRRSTGLQKATLTALRTAVPYCWAPKCVEAVAMDASMLDLQARPNEIPLGEYSAPAAAGWWWFERPIPLKTTIGGESVIALSWKREVRTDGASILDALGGEETVSGPLTLTWFNAFIHEPVNVYGRDVLAPNPTLAWIWVDTCPIAQLEQNLQTRFRLLDTQKRAGQQSAPADVCAATGLWLSKFWLSACVWLQERVILGHQGMPLPRQQGRQIMREQHLKEPPLVEVVYLRAAEPVPHEVVTTHGTRDYQWRWTVRRHTRRQWYPSLGRHQLKTVKAHVKGPADKPLKVTTKVYAVNR